MMNIPVTDFVIVLLIFMRIIAAFVVSPIFGDRAFPVIAKIFLALVISYICFLTIDKSKITVEFGVVWLMVNALKEVITGAILGFMLNFVFYAVQFAGSLIGLSMELSMAETLNPIDGSSTNVISQAYYFASILILFLINGHHYIISGLVYSFSIVHLGKYAITTPVYQLIIQYAGAVFVIAVKIASPILVSFFLVYIGEGILTRVVPQMQVFFVTQPLILILGFFLLVSLTPMYIYAIKSLLHGYEDNLVTIIKAMAK